MRENKYYSAKIYFLALFSLFTPILFSQNNFSTNEFLFEKNHWGIQATNAISPAFRVDNPLKEYVYIKFLPNYQFGVGFKYIFNINKKYGIETGFNIEFRSIGSEFNINAKAINNALNIVPNDTLRYLNSTWDKYNTTEITFGQFYQNFSIPIVFKFNAIHKLKYFLSASFGFKARYYFASSYEGGITYANDYNGKLTDIDPFVYEIKINSKNSIEIDNIASLSINFILKNKKILTLSLLSNIALHKVNKGSIIYLRNTSLEHKEDVIVNDNYWGISVGYLFTGVNNPNNKLLKNRKIEWFPNEDEDY